MKLEDIAKHELIGLMTTITESTNKSQKGIKGKIIDETKHTIKIQTKNGTKTIQKKNITIEIEVENKKIRINGKVIEGKPEERVKGVKKWKM